MKMRNVYVAVVLALAGTDAAAGTLRRCDGPVDVDHNTGTLTVEAPRDGQGATAYLPVTGWVMTAATLDCSSTPLAAFGAVVSGYGFHATGTYIDVIVDGEPYKGIPLTSDGKIVAVFKTTYALPSLREKIVNAASDHGFEQFGVVNAPPDFRNRRFPQMVQIRVLARADLAVGTHALGASALPLVYFIGSDTTPVSSWQDMVANGAQLWTTGTLVKTATTCTATVPATVSLESAKQSDFLADGSKVVNEKSFTISLNCPASGRGVTVRATMTDANDAGNLTNALKNPGGASNAHFRLKNPADGDIRFGPDSAAAGTLNQFAVATVPAAGNPNLPVVLKVGYGNAGGLPGSGRVTGKATITFSYQ